MSEPTIQLTKAEAAILLSWASLIDAEFSGTHIGIDDDGRVLLGKLREFADDDSDCNL